MSTDIKVSGSLVFPEGAPARAGEVVNNIEEVRDIPAPRVGMIVYDKSTRLNYIVRSLKEKVIDGVRVDNAQVDEYELYDVTAESERAEREEQANADAITAETARAKKAEEEINTRIDESLGGYDISIMSAGLYFDKVNNKGERFGDPILIPNADIAGMGLMSQGDKTYLDSLDDEGKLEIAFTESNYSFKLSSEGYADIPKGVHIQIESDTITELIGYYAGMDGAYVPQTLVDGTITEGVIIRISNKEEIGDVTIKYTGQIKELQSAITDEENRAKEAEKANTDAIAELLKRIQGISEESSASTDPFRFLGEFSDPTKKDLHDALNSLHSTNKADGYEGIWRFNVQGKPSTLYNLALNYGKDNAEEEKWLQGLITIYSPSSNPGDVFTLNNKINILYRIYNGSNKTWSTWRNITQDNSDAIAAETIRAKKVEEELRQTAVTKKRNYIHATSDEAYIISKYNNKYDIIIHFAKTLKNEIYTIESVYLVNNTNTELSTDITREPVYRFCQQQTSDMIGPVSVRTGTNGLSWVGGNHLHMSQESGVKTAETLGFAVNADDTAIGNGRMYAEKITIRVKNVIYDPNVGPVSGANILSSRLIEEFVTYTVDKGEVLVSVEHRYVKDIYVATYYGIQSMFAQYSSIITNTLTDWKDKNKSSSQYSILKDDANDFNRFSQKDANGYYQNTILLPYGIGKHQLIKDGERVFVEEGSKAYHVLIKSQNIKANDVLTWMGIYSWKTPIIDNEYNYIYSYSDNNGENISVTAKQVYENKTVPVSPSLTNKVYESDGVVKVDDIIGYNIVLSASNVGSSIIKELTKATEDIENNAKAITAETARAKKAEEGINTRIDESLGDFNFSLTSGGLYVDKFNNKGDVKGEPILIPSADIAGMGLMSRGDKTYLDSLDDEGELEITFTESNYSFKLSSEGYADIPKGVHIQIESDTITELIGYYAGLDGAYVPQTLVDGAITEGVIIRISNKEEIGDVTIKYTGAIKSLFEEAVKFDTLEVEVLGDGVGINYGTFDEHSASIEIPLATTEKAGVMSAEDKKALNEVKKSSATKIIWNSNSNMNDFKTPGVYDIYGERTVKTDNLPITNDGSGHSISARLTVVASTLQPANNEICVTQFLQLSNRVGGDGATYVRTYNENNNGMNGWSPWQKQMGMVETLINSNDTTVGQEVFSGSAQRIGDGLNGMIDNGMYSGIYIDNIAYSSAIYGYYLLGQPTFVETFVLVVINDYAASGKLNLPRHITQLKYAVDAITGQSTVKKRVGTGNDTISWGDWEDIGGGGAVAELMQEVTYSELVALRDNSNLLAGMKYRITDYVTTTVQQDTKSANHPFDVIVEAVSENELSELAQAIQHEGDTYFDGSDLGAWQLWYSLDNDTEKYAWADAKNGKGVIYRMIDEKRNDCPYDFKNIMFVRYELSAPNVGGYGYNWQNKMSENINEMFEENQLSYIWHGNNNEDDYYWEDDMGEVISSPTGETKAFFTFSNVVNNIVTDKSITSVCYSNIIKESRDGAQLRLNNIVFFSIDINNSCYSNSFGNSCNSNSFGNDCYSNSFGNSCYSNSFGNSCNSNSFGNSCYYNSFGNSCNSNSFGNDCYYNSFGNSCNSNSFGNDCYSNSFGNSCNSNSFGNSCNSNSFRDGPAYAFDEDYWEYSYDDELIDGVRSNKFGDRCRNLIIHTRATTGGENSIQNLNIAQGLCSIELDDKDVFIPLPIEIDIVGQNYELKIGRDSKDEIKVYCEADLV